MKSYDATFHRLGQRNYVQGSTLIDQFILAMEAWKIEPIDRLEASCRSMINEKGRYELLESPTPEELKLYRSTFKAWVKEEKFIVGLKALDEDFDERVSYDEDAMVSKATLNKQEGSISLNYLFQQDLYQYLIALFKKLLNETHPAADGHKWIFYQTKLEHRKLINIQSKQLTIKIKRVLGQQSAQADILIENEKMGNIFFTQYDGGKK